MFENKIAEYREDLIQVKKEKHKLGAEVKSLTEENNHVKSVLKIYINDVEETKRELMKVTKKPEEEVEKIKKEKDSLKTNGNNMRATN